MTKLSSPRRDHPIYQEILSTGLFEELGPGLFSMAEFRLIGGPIQYTLCFIYIFNSKPNYCLDWYTQENGDLSNLATKRVSFESIFEECSSELQEKLLFHLDLLLCRKPKYYAIDKSKK